MTVPDSVNSYQATLQQIVDAISQRQPVLNIDSFSDTQLQTNIIGIGSLDKATNNQLSFLTSAAYIDALPCAKAAVIIVAAEHAQQVPPDSIAIVVSLPYVAYASASQLFETVSVEKDHAASLEAKNNTEAVTSLTAEGSTASPLVHRTAIVADTAILGDNVRVGPFCLIGEHVYIGDDTQLQSHVHVGDHTHLGSQCVIYPHVYIAYHCHIGNNVRIHANASIGSEGFGFAPMPDTATEGWERIVQLGRVIIGDNVRIGSQTCIDRGAINDTVLEDNVIIDNLVQVGHNSVIGAGTAIAGNAGLAGSSTLGKRCMIGGAAGLSGHLEVTDDVILTGMTMVTKSIKVPGVYSSGIAAMPSKQWRRVMVSLRHLAEKED